MDRSKHVAITLIVALVASGFSGLPHLEAATSSRTDELKQRVEAFGTGAEVSIELRTGRKIRGTVDSIDAEQVRLNDRPQAIPFEDIVSLKVIKVVYGSAEFRATRVSAAVKELGYNHAVKVQLVSGKAAKGRIQHFETKAFHINDENAAPAIIPYDDVRELEPVGKAPPTLRAFPPPQAQTSSPKLVLRNLAIASAVVLVIFAVCKGRTGCLP
jgi:small nuclear ribonucleoprotein (snRNP)-like protein